MATTLSDGERKTTVQNLTLVQIKRIDTALTQIGNYGAVKLIVENGTIKFMEVTVSKKL